MIDSHAHLTDPVLSRNCGHIIDLAKKAGVEQIMVPAVDMEDSRRVIELVQNHDCLKGAAGITPHQAARAPGDYLKKLGILLRKPGIAAVGEIGLDYHYSEPRDIQCDLFEAQLALAREIKMPVIIHMRESFDDAHALLKRSGIERGVCHCFTGNRTQAGKFLDLGLHISFAGIITYKNSNYDEVIKSVPTDRLMVETDSPYLAPEPHRKETNSPHLLIHTVKKIARLLHPLNAMDISRITGFNARRLFNMDDSAATDTVAYPIRNSIYLNITNRCCNSCVFCPLTQERPWVKGYDLKLHAEPSTGQVIEALERFELDGFREVVFCGFGEPTFRMQVIKEVATFLKRYNIKIRLNTNGQGNLINKRDIIPELSGLVDEISVSLNFGNAGDYLEFCRSRYGSEAFGAVTDFIKRAREVIPLVQATAVRTDDLDLDALEKLARELGAPLRLRPYQEIG
jgi:TatD DNase family protein